MTYSIDENFFKNIDSEEKSYFLGLLYADGNHYINSKIKQITLELNIDDIELIEKFKSAVKTDKPIKKRKGGITGKYRSKDKAGLVISNYKMSNLWKIFETAILYSGNPTSNTLKRLEQDERIELSCKLWKSFILPLNESCNQLLYNR